MLDLFASPPDKPLALDALTMGVFDGLHRGHRHLIDVLCSERHGGEIGLVTFTAHPEELLHGEAPARLITSGQRDRLLADWGVDRVFELSTTSQLLALEPAGFMRRFKAWFDPRVIVVGSNFRFGKGGEGRAETLTQINGCRVRVVESLNCEDGVPISATRVRQALAAGRIEEANRLLGRHYAVVGVESPGDGIGRTMGSPTLNISPVPEAVCDGIYVVTTPLGNGVAHLGPRPTFHSDERRFEIHIIDPFQHAASRQWEVAFHARLRDVRSYDTVPALASAIAEDIRRARTLLAR